MFFYGTDPSAFRLLEPLIGDFPAKPCLVGLLVGDVELILDAEFRCSGTEAAIFFGEFSMLSRDSFALRMAPVALKLTWSSELVVRPSSFAIELF